MADTRLSIRLDLTDDDRIGPGKVALLEAIRDTGSISGAARRLKMSYRRAWLLLEDLNTSFQQPVARMSVGGKGGGGASLTAFGNELVAAYRELEAHIRKRAQTAFPATAVPAAEDSEPRRAALKRKVKPTAPQQRRQRRAKG
jgi:molybdate transport system regulatory protein